MNKRQISLTAIFCISAVATGVLLASAFAPTPLFQQNFVTDDPADPFDLYESATPDNTQFNDIRSTAGTAVSVAGGALQYTRAGGSGAFTRTTDFNPIPSAIVYQFDLTVSGNSAVQTSAAVFQVGSGFTANSSVESNAQLYARLGVNFAATDDSFSLRDITNSTNSAAFSGTQTITWVLNNAGGTLTYTAPGGAAQTVANDTADIYVGATQVFNDVGVQTPTQTISDIKFNFNAGVGTVRLDNFLIRVLAPPTPDAPDLQPASDTGESSTDNRTNVAALSFTITGVAAGASVELLRDGVPAATGTATGQSIVLTDATASADGTYSYTARQTIAGLTSDESAALAVTVDRAAPSVGSIRRASVNPTALNTSVVFTVLFSEPVTASTVDVGDFAITATGGATATVTSVVGSGNRYDVTVSTGSGSGTIRLDVVDNDSILDTAGNPLGGAGASNGNFTAGETYTVNANAPAPLVVNTVADRNDNACTPLGAGGGNQDCTLREAIAAAQPGDAIEFSALFDAPREIVLNETLRTLIVDKSLTIRGKGANLTTVRRSAQAATQFRVFDVSTQNPVSISGLTIAGGSGASSAGGITSCAVLTLAGVHVTGNAGGRAGGIYNEGTLNLVGSTVSRNSAAADNFGDAGGGIASVGVALNVTDSTVSGNRVLAGSKNGGGLYATGNARIVNSTIADNEAAGDGASAGGVYVAGGAATVRNSIIAANCTRAAAGICSQAVAPDVGADNSGSFVSQGYNLIGNRGALAGFDQNTDQTGGGNRAIVDPRLDPLADYGGATPTHRLKTASPAVDKGDDGSAAPTRDQRGQARPVDLNDALYPNAAGGDGSDIGAFELQQTEAPVIADVSVTKTAQTNHVSPGSRLAYIITVTNNSQSAAPNVRLTDVLPAGTTFVSLIQTGGAENSAFSCTTPAEGANGTVVCSINSLPANAVAVFQLLVQVSGATVAGSQISNTARVSTTAVDPNQNNNSSTVATLVGAPDLSIRKTHSGNFLQGGTGQYQITVTNVGAAPTRAAVTVTDDLPPGLTLQNITGIGWNCVTNEARTDLTCTRSDVLLAGASYSVIAFTVRIAANAPANVINTARVSGGGDANAANNAAADPTAIGAARFARFDYDGDGRSDVSVFRPDDGAWYLLGSTAGYAAFRFGLGTDALAPADFDGDGRTDLGVFRDGNWYFIESDTGLFRGVQWGQAGDVPQAAYFDGDRRADFAVYRPSNGTWYLLQSAAGYAAVRFGAAADKPVAADFDGDRRAEIAV